MNEGKRVYNPELQEEIGNEAKALIMGRYGNDPTVLGIYLGGSLTDGTFGEYDKPIHEDTIPRIGSDIDIMVVIRDRIDPCPLPENDRQHYGVRLVEGQTALYRMVDEEGRELNIRGKHPIDTIIITKDIYDGILSGRYPWGPENARREFLPEARKFKVLKETQELREVRKRYLD